MAGTARVFGAATAPLPLTNPHAPTPKHGQAPAPRRPPAPAPGGPLRSPISPRPDPSARRLDLDRMTAASVDGGHVLLLRCDDVPLSIQELERRNAEAGRARHRR